MVTSRHMNRDGFFLSRASLHRRFHGAGRRSWTSTSSARSTLKVSRSRRSGLDEAEWWSGVRGAGNFQQCCVDEVDELRAQNAHKESMSRVCRGIESFLVS